MHDLAGLRRAIDADSELAALLTRVEAELSTDPAHDLDHALRVALWTVRLGGERIAFRSAIAAALLHDFVYVPKDSPERAKASELSAAAAREILPSYRFAPGAIEEIAAAICDHSYSRGGRPSSELGKALQDADRLEALGSLGIFRTIVTGVRMGSLFFHPNDPWAEARALDDRAHSLDHFFTKIFRLPRTMNTNAGREEAERRVGRMRVFVEGLADELGRPIPPSRWEDVSTE